MVTSTSMKSIELNFELGVEFEETTADGRQVKCFKFLVSEIDYGYVSVKMISNI
jgi:hypothetical protein